MTAPRHRASEGDGSAGRPPKGERKRKLRAAATELFACQGYRATTLEQIAATAEVSPAQAARHFDNKLAVLRGVVAGLPQRLLEPPADADAGEPSPLQRLTDLYVGAPDRLGPEGRVILRVLSEGDDAEAMAAVRTALVETQERLLPLIQAGQQAGLFRRSLDPLRSAGEVLRVLLTACWLADLDLPPTADADNPTLAIDCLLHGLLKTDV